MLSLALTVVRPKVAGLWSVARIKISSAAEFNVSIRA
jgi:hypothetical protein